MSPTRRLGLFLGIALATVVVSFAVVLMHHSTRVAYENGQAIVTGAVVDGHQSFCQPTSLAPARATSLTVWVSTAYQAGGPLRVRVYGPRGLVTTGHASGGYVNSAVTIPIRPLRSDLVGAVVCVDNLGPRRAAFMGETAAAAPPARIVKRPIVPSDVGGAAAHVSGGPPGAPVTVRLEWRLPGRPSWLDFSPVVARRAALGKPSGAGPWTSWLVMALALAAAGAATTIVIRHARAAAIAAGTEVP